MHIDRRQFIIGGTTAIAGAGALWSVGVGTQMAPSFVAPLPVPRLVDLTMGGDVFDLVIKEGRTRIVPWAETGTYGYSGSLLGPVVRVKSASV